MDRLGLIYTDFSVYHGTRDILREDIVDPKTNRPIGSVTLYRKDNAISVCSGKKEVSALTQKGKYKEDGKVVPYRKLTRQVLLAKEEYRSLEDMGITHAYFLGKKSSLDHVFCLRKGKDLAGIIEAEDSDVNALKGLTLVLAQRVEDQDYIFDFMRK